jgi:hypothetical protein
VDYTCDKLGFLNPLLIQFLGETVLFRITWLICLAVHDAKDDEDETQEAHGRCQLDTTETENLWIEEFLCTSASAHKYEANDDDNHADGQENVILFSEG